MKNPRKNPLDLAKEAAIKAGLNPGFDDIKRCKLSTPEKERVREAIAKSSSPTYSGEPMEKTKDVLSGVAKVSVEDLKKLINPSELNPPKLDNAICDVANNEAEMPAIISRNGGVIIDDGNHRITAMGDLGYDHVDVSYPLDHEDDLQDYFGKNFLPLKRGE